MLETATEEVPMTDLANWKVHGPVHTLRTELAEWDLSLQQWKPPHPFTLVRFNPDGKIGETEHHNADGSIARASFAYDADGRLRETRSGISDKPTRKSVYSYDAAGRLARVVSVDLDGTESEAEVYSNGQDGKRTRVQFISKQGANIASYAIEGSEVSYGAPGAVTITTRYDDREQPDEVLFKDQDHRVVRRVVFTRDSAGRLVREEAHLGEQLPFPSIEKELENQPPEAREKLLAAFSKAFGPQLILFSASYSYDEKGRLAERRRRTGELDGGQRTTYRYDDRGNPIEEIDKDKSIDWQIDDTGNSRPTKEISHTQNSRFEYAYDAEGNWTEKVLWSRLEPNPNFQLSNMERREITYFTGK
jgi:hypothetical protein